jgi:hypothetical protein
VEEEVVGGGYGFLTAAKATLVFLVHRNVQELHILAVFIRMNEVQEPVIPTADLA